ncbi:hypothetical protein [Botrimarina sp.]|uniref:hypothetical protein n=1 Tax=Botrimarina sp. TaxID=2795802 RepID=UPI0032EE5713
MIYFLTTRRASYTIRVYLDRVAIGLRPLIVPLTYEAWLSRRDHPPGVYVLADIERLSARQRERAAVVADDVSARPGFRVVNHPLRSLRRRDLLDTLQSRGENRFAVWRPGEPDRPLRYPVFVRRENDHTGPRTPLLRDRAQLSRALWRLRTRWKGWRPLLVTEFLDTADSDGLYRKYAAFRVGERIVPRSLFFSRRWMVKACDLTHPKLLQEEQAYFFNNPHAPRLKAIFQLAGIDYGRIDYGLYGGAIQTWEINTNPTLPTGLTASSGPRHEVLLRCRRQLEAAFQTLAGSADTVARPAGGADAAPLAA